MELSIKIEFVVLPFILGSPWMSFFEYFLEYLLFIELSFPSLTLITCLDCLQDYRAMILYNLREWGGDLPLSYSLNHPIYRTYWFITISIKWLSKIDVKSLELAPNDRFHIHFKHRKETCLLIVLFMSTYKNMYSLLTYSFHGHRLMSQSAHEAVSRPVETIWWCQSRGRVTLMQIPWLLTKQKDLILNDFYSWDPLSGLFLRTMSPFESHIVVYNITGSWIRIACVLLIWGILRLVF